MKTRYNSVDDVIATHRSITGEPGEAVFAGNSFAVLPGVFSPFIAPSGFLGLSFASLPVFEGSTVLDIGSGSGIPSCLFALNGADRVIGVDINPEAIEAGRTSSLINNVDDIVSFREGSLFEPIKEDEQFDIVFADLPFMARDPSDMLERAFFDPELSLIRGYLKGVRERFGASGSTQAYVCLSDLEQHDLPPFAEQLGLRWEEVLAVQLPWVRLSLIQVL